VVAFAPTGRGTLSALEVLVERVCAECAAISRAARCAVRDDGSPTIVVGPPRRPGGSHGGRPVRREDLVGSGGMGAVYRARQLSMDRDVALKVCVGTSPGTRTPSGGSSARAKAASRLKSPHTITVFDFGQMEDGQLYLAMELLTGRPLSRLMDGRRPPLELGRAAAIVQSRCSTPLMEAHSAGRPAPDSIKADNVFVAGGGGPRTSFVKVLDFGIAKDQGGAARRR